MLSQTDHGPFGGGANMLKKREVMQYLVDKLTVDDFAELVEGIRFDREVPHLRNEAEHSATDKTIKLPMVKEDLLSENAVAKLSHNVA